MAGNPCYILTITTDVKKNDINISSLTGGDKSASYKKESASNVDKNAQSSQVQTSSNGNQNSQSNNQGAASSQNVNESGTECTEKAEKEPKEEGTNEKGRRRPK